MRNSAWMEHEGLVRAVRVISDAGLNIAQLITDRHKQNTAWIKRNLPETAHYFDIWHVSKGTMLFFVQIAVINTHTLETLLAYSLWQLPGSCTKIPHKVVCPKYKSSYCLTSIVEL